MLNRAKRKRDGESEALLYPLAVKQLLYPRGSTQKVEEKWRKTWQVAHRRRKIEND